MRTVLKKTAFQLPRVGKEKFILLIQLGLEYNRDQRTFSIKNYNNIEKLMDTITNILNTEVVFLQNCTRCGKEFGCDDCKYNENCTTKYLPLSCVCPQCLIKRKQFEEYLQRF